jgi:hypothetical protein
MNGAPIPASVHVEDQLLAAVEDAHRLLDALGKDAGLPINRLPNGVDPWIDEQIDGLFALWNSGQAHTCVHTANPTPLCATAWRPGLILCVLCAAFAFEAKGAEDATCDICRAHVPGAICANQVQAGPFFFTWGCCVPCQEAHGWRTQEAAHA